MQDEGDTPSAPGTSPAETKRSDTETAASRLDDMDDKVIAILGIDAFRNFKARLDKLEKSRVLLPAAVVAAAISGVVSFAGHGVSYINKQNEVRLEVLKNPRFQYRCAVRKL